MPIDNNPDQGRVGDRAATKDFDPNSCAGDVETNRCHQVSEDSDHGYGDHATRDIGILELVSVGWSICNSWVGVLSTIAFVVNQGGPPTLVYGLPLIFIMYGCIVCSLGELASVYSSAGGQYHWTSILAPNSWGRVLSYSCGLINIFAWISIAAGVGIIIPQILTAPIIHYNPAYAPKTWHIFIIYQAGSAACLLHNIFALRRSMWFFNLIFGLSVATFFVATVTCLARAPSFQSHLSVWVTFVNRTGWESDGVVFLTGILSPGYMYAGLDGAIHLAEESKNPTTAVPRALMSTWIVGFLTSFVIAIACMYSAQDFDKIASTPTGLPVFELFRQAMRSDVASTVMLVVMLLAGFAALAGCQQTASRLTWAFARDHGLFGSSKLSHMDEQWLVPVWALCANATVIFIIGCVYLGSSTAFNAFIGTGLILQLITFAFPAALLLLRRRSAQYLPKSRKFKVPAVMGWVANAGTVGFTIIVTIFWCLPTVFPVEPSNMSKFVHLDS
ncbi:amino acid transporter [Hortaea werneckii]|nr:amino acid transporter [Hortaea werneckii]